MNAWTNNYYNEYKRNKQIRQHISVTSLNQGNSRRLFVAQKTTSQRLTQKQKNKSSLFLFISLSLSFFSARIRDSLSFQTNKQEEFSIWPQLMGSNGPLRTADRTLESAVQPSLCKRLTALVKSDFPLRTWLKAEATVMMETNIWLVGRQEFYSVYVLKVLTLCIHTHIHTYSGDILASYLWFCNIIGSKANVEGEKQKTAKYFMKR